MTAGTLYSLRGKRVWVAGETGLVGRALVRALKERCAETDLISMPHARLDLCDAAATADWLSKTRPDVVFMAAGRVGGIGANMAQPADFLHDNLAMAQSVIHGAHLAGVERLVYLGSSCIYPRDAVQPIAEEALLTGLLEPTNEPYAIAKIAGLKMVQAYRRQYGRKYISAMPTNLYGPHDRFDAENGHVIPAMMVKFHEAKKVDASAVTLWGTGKPRREFLYVDDLAEALLIATEKYDGDLPLNIGCGRDISIHDLAIMMAEVVGYKGDIVFNSHHPDGVLRKLLDVERVHALGWQAVTNLPQGLDRTYKWYVYNGVR